MPFIKFRYGDLFLAPRLALGPKSLWLQTRGVIYAVLVYAAFCYVALAASGQDLYRFWGSYYLFLPVATLGDGVTLEPWSYGIWGAGTVLAACFLLLSMTEVAKITVERLRGNDFYSTREATAFRRKQTKSVLLAPLVIGAALLLFFICLGLAGVAARIPVVGDVVASVAFFPATAAAAFIILIAVVLALSILYTPAITAATGDDPFECAFELFAVATGQPWRLASYLVTTSALSLAAGAFAGGWAAAAVAGVRWTFMGLGGEKAGDAMAAALRVLPTWLRGAYTGEWQPFLWLSGQTEGIGVIAGGVSLPLPWPQAVAATIYAVVLLFILALVTAYTLSVFTCGQTITYVVLRKKKDDENLLELYDEDIEKTVLEMNENCLKK